MGSLTPATLYPRRLAVRAFELVLDRLDLLGMAIRLNPDDPSQVLPGADPGEVWIYDDFRGGAGRVLATAQITGSVARVVVEQLDRFIRAQHVATFREEHVRRFRRRGWPDLDATVDLSEVLEVEGARLRGPARPAIARPRPRSSGAIRSFGARR